MDMVSNSAMFILMLFAGLLANMNIFDSDWHDISWTLNDLYMALLMTGLTFIFMGLYSRDRMQLLIGFITSIASFLAIRLQLFISQQGYLFGMIPHHSMAIFTSQKLLRRSDVSPEVRQLAQNIIASQTPEITQMKYFLRSNK